MLDHNTILWLVSVVLGFICILTGTRILYNHKIAISSRSDEALGSEFIIASEDVSTNEPASEALQEMAALVFNRGDFQLASSLFRQALDAREKADGAEHSNVASALQGLGASLRQLGNLVEAQPSLERALAIREQSLTPNYPAVAVTVQELAWLAFDRGTIKRRRTFSAAP
jgi:tetratricopeptide (TPR) repeat protein